MQLKVILTNYGHRYITQIIKRNEQDLIRKVPEHRILKNILDKHSDRYMQNETSQKLYQEGFIKELPKMWGADKIKMAYRRNPIENANTVVFEFTTACNFNCLHCRNGNLPSHTETNIDNLKATAKSLIYIGIRRFAFIGGEVTKFGHGWLDLTKYIQNLAPCTIGVFTNGWWADASNFEAAGKTYLTPREYLNDLKANGVTHIVFSIDGEQKTHDIWRKKRGLFEKIKEAIQLCHECEIKPRLSMVIFEGFDAHYNLFDELSKLIYPDFADLSSFVRLKLLLGDSDNTFSNFIDIGNGVSFREGKYSIQELNINNLRCKAFYRPYPNIRISASGEFSNCPLCNASEGFGNIHEKNIIKIINQMQEKFVFKLHSEKRINDYVKYLDTNVFGEKFDHICSFRTVLTLLAREMHANGVSANDKKAIRRINEKVGFLTGHLK